MWFKLAEKTCRKTYIIFFQTAKGAAWKKIIKTNYCINLPKKQRKASYTFCAAFLGKFMQ